MVGLYTLKYQLDTGPGSQAVVYVEFFLAYSDTYGNSDLKMWMKLYLTKKKESLHFLDKNNYPT